MSEITREHAFFNIRTVLNAFVNKVENAKGYIEYLSPEGKDIVQAYESDKDNCKTLLFAAKENDEFFNNLSDEEFVEYVNICYELNKLFGLRVKNLYKVKKIIDNKRLFYFEQAYLYIDARQTGLVLSEVFPKLFSMDYYSNIVFYNEIAKLLGIEDMNHVSKIYEYDFTEHGKELFEIFIENWGKLDENKILFIEKFDEEHGTNILAENISMIRHYYLEKLLNKNDLFSGTYKFLKIESLDTYCVREYIPKFGYFIDFSIIKQLKQKSILQPSFTSFFGNDFEKPSYSFFIEPQGLEKFNNILAGMSLGMRDSYIRINPPVVFYTSNTNQVIKNHDYKPYRDDGNRNNGLESFKKNANNAPKRPMKGTIPIPSKIRASSNVELLANKNDKVSAYGGFLILAGQSVAGAISAFKLNTLFVNVWNTNIDQINFFSIQLPRCNNLDLIYDYQFLSTTDKDFEKIMRNLKL